MNHWAWYVPEPRSLHLRYTVNGANVKMFCIWPAATLMIAVWNVFATASALAADGTWPRLDSRTSAPVSESFFTLAPVTAFFAIFLFVTAFFRSCFGPTLFVGRAVAA